MSRPKEFWIDLLSNIAMPVGEVNFGGKTGREPLPYVHVIERSADGQLKNKLDTYEDKVYHLSRRVEELEYLLKVTNDRNFK